MRTCRGEPSPGTTGYIRSGELKEYPLSSTISLYLIVRGRTVRGHEEEHEESALKEDSLRSGRVDRKVAFVIGDFLEAGRRSL